MSILKQLIARTMRGELSKLDGLYQRHAGQECYIFGDGVSLKWMHLDQFAGRPSILGGASIFHREAYALDIAYYSLIEPFQFYPLFPYRGEDGKFRLVRHHHYKEICKSIIQNPGTRCFINYSNYPVARFPNAIYVSRWYKPPFEIKNPFRDRVDSHDGTLKFQISLAIYLGFKKAFLVGHDYTHFPARSLHFYEKGEGQLNIDGHRDFSREFINFAKQHIDLVTVTLDGSSETMNHVTYKDLTGKEPSFRENTEIVDRVKLESLATWRGYSIF